MDRKTPRGNRLGLLIVGLVLTVLGCLTVARGVGSFSRAGAPAGEPLLNGPVRGAFAHSLQLWWVIAVAGIVLTLLGLRWLLAQGRRAKLGGIRLASGPGGVTDVHTGGVADAMAADVSAHPAILRASAAMIGTETHPAVRLRVMADETIPMDAIREQLDGVAIPRMRRALETERIPAIAQVSLEEPPRHRRTVV
ncbi:hypothetical protein [Streptosporangium sp. NPDC087985]|uniref:hypothetical protein n=1 Tax=Streptosporangium sp. NPDC087985 TaxID=3366196 RepID=UPI0038241791